MLSPSMLKQRKDYEVIDNPTIRYILLLIVVLLIGWFIYQYMQCNSIQTKYLL